MDEQHRQFEIISAQLRVIELLLQQIVNLLKDVRDDAPGRGYTLAEIFAKEKK